MLGRVDRPSQSFAPDGTPLTLGPVLARLAFVSLRIERRSLSLALALLERLTIGAFSEPTAEAFAGHGAVLALLRELPGLTLVAERVRAALALALVLTFTAPAAKARLSVSQ